MEKGMVPLYFIIKMGILWQKEIIKMIKRIECGNFIQKTVNLKEKSLIEMVFMME